MTEAYDGPQVIGMDLHRRRWVLVRMTEDGRRPETARITSSALELQVTGMPSLASTACTWSLPLTSLIIN
jgi:hypothetical protein